MSRGVRWWGTSPLVVGAGGLLLLVFGAPGMQGGDEINAPARQEAEDIEKQLNNAEQPREAARILQTEEMMLKERGKTVDLRSLAPKKGELISAEQAAEVRKRIYDALSDHIERGSAIAERLAFYAGLILVFAAGVLLYLRAPESNRAAW